MQNSKQIGGFVGALVIGVAAGAAIGLLFAPNKGSKTRKKLTSSAKKVIENLSQETQDKFKLLKKNAKGFEESLSKGLQKTN